MATEFQIPSRPYRPSRPGGSIDPATKRLAVIAVALAGGVTLTAGGWSMLHRHSGAVPVIEADSSPVRVKPADPGGMKVLGVSDDLSADDPEGKSSALAAAPEAPQPQKLAEEIRAAEEAKLAAAKAEAARQEAARAAAAKAEAARVQAAQAAAAKAEAAKTEARAAPPKHEAARQVAETPAPPAQPSRAVAQAAPEPAPAQIAARQAPALTLPPLRNHRAVPGSVPGSVPGPAHNALAARTAPANAPVVLQAMAQAPAAVPHAAPTEGPGTIAGAAQGHAPTSQRAEVQLAAVGSEEAAGTEWRRLAQRMPDLLGGRQPVVERATLAGRTFWRLRTGGFADLTAATAFCEHVRAKGAACAVARF